VVLQAAPADWSTKQKASPAKQNSDNKEDRDTHNQQPAPVEVKMGEATNNDEAGPSAAPSTTGEQQASEQAADDDGMWVDPAVFKEEEAARKAREKAAKARPVQSLTKEKLLKLDKLVDQATMYSQFLGEQVSSVQGQWQVVRTSL
jgi:hypothetical protein